MITITNLSGTDSDKRGNYRKEGKYDEKKV